MKCPEEDRCLAVAYSFLWTIAIAPCTRWWWCTVHVAIPSPHVSRRQVLQHQPRYPNDNDKNAYLDFDPYLDDELFPDQYHNRVNIYNDDVLASPCPICVAAFVRALYPEATMFSIDPEDDDVAVRRRLLRPRNDYDDYFVYFPDVDYFLYYNADD